MLYTAMVADALIKGGHQWIILVTQLTAGYPHGALKPAAKCRLILSGIGKYRASVTSAPVQMSLPPLAAK